ncbi:hypothetical protein ACFVWN_02350 [Nocardiopsis flavescens]|uniref:hypothetical protein n=1 Tax=Nocardiopsis flavescens TaxID=758803 RepID=UPI003658CCB1
MDFGTPPRALAADPYARCGGSPRLWVTAPDRGHGHDRLGVPEPEGGRTGLDEDAPAPTPGGLRPVVLTSP